MAIGSDSLPGKVESSLGDLVVTGAANLKADAANIDQMPMVNSDSSE